MVENGNVNVGGNNVISVSLLCDFMMCLHGKVRKLRHKGVHPKYAVKDDSVFFFLPFF